MKVAYAIGIAEPMSVLVNTFGTGTVDEERLAKLVRRHFPLKPHALIEHLDLLRPIYEKTAAYGHFGRREKEFTWEKTDLAERLRADVGSTVARSRVARRSKQ